MTRVLIAAPLAAFIAGLSLAAATSAPTAAQAGEGMTPLEIAQQIFARADSDGNGALTEAEHKAAGLGRFGASFADFDLNNDSTVTLQEYEAVFERFHRGMGGSSA